MTRINAGIPVQQLNGKHLIAEHREIKRVPNLVRYNIEKGNPISGIPPKFTLGKGHVKFFYDKLGYLLNRYKEIYQECLSRGYNIQNYENAWEGIPEELMSDYNPTQEDISIIQQRINERLGIK